MSITVRQQQIIELLEANRFLRVDQLAAMCYASPSSIRRDLTRLQNLHYVKRTHGGVAIVGAEQVLTLNARMTTAIREKKQIAKKAATLLRDG